MRRPRDESSFREYSYVARLRKNERIAQEITGNLPRVAFIFPNNYTVASSSLAWSWVQQLLWREGIGAERFFYEKWFRRYYSVETQRPLDEFPVWAFTFQFENDLLNITDLLKKKKIPPRAYERDDHHPLILVGGPVPLFNHEILGEVADATFVGDLEPWIIPFSEALKEESKTKIVEKLATLEPVYAPIVGKTTFKVRPSHFDEPPVAHFTTPHSVFKNKLLVEIGRGCVRRCTFCVTGYVKKPVKFATLEHLLERIEEKLNQIPNLELGIISATITDYPYLDELLDYIEARDVPFSVSALRIDNVTERLLRLLKKSEKQSLTIAPEGISQKVRDIMLKDMDTDGIIKGLELARKVGFSKVKMYYIVGLEEEDESDFVELRKFLERVVQMGFTQLTLSVNPLVPKPKTPFAERRMIERGEYHQRLKLLKKTLPRQVSLEFESYREADLQYMISRLELNQTLDFVEGVLRTFVGQ